MGDNSFGQLGLSLAQKAPGRPSPTLVEKLSKTEKIKEIGCGDNHSFAITFSGTVYAWGNGLTGQLGLGSEKKQFFPQRLKFRKNRAKQPRIAQADGGKGHSMFLTSEGKLYVTGDNQYGQLGFSNLSKTSTPILNDMVPERVQEVACGSQHSLILTSKPKNPNFQFFEILIFLRFWATVHLREQQKRAARGRKQTNVLYPYPGEPDQGQNRPEGQCR